MEILRACVYWQVLTCEIWMSNLLKCFRWYDNLFNLFTYPIMSVCCREYVKLYLWQLFYRLYKFDKYLIRNIVEIEGIESHRIFYSFYIFHRILYDYILWNVTEGAINYAFKSLYLIKAHKKLYFLIRSTNFTRLFLYEYLMWNVLQDVSNFFCKLDEIFYKHLAKDIVEDMLNRAFQNCLFSL